MILSFIFFTHNSLMFDPPNKSIAYQTLKVKRNVLTTYKIYVIISVEGFMFKVTTFPVKLVEGMEKAVCGQRNVRGKIVEFSTLLELATHASEWTISPVVLKNAYRKNENFESSSLIMVDVDDHMGLDECLAMLDMKQVEFALYTSFSHSEAKDKFHIILPLDREVTEECDYKATHDYVSKNFFSRVNDNATSSASNLFYNGNPKTIRIETNQENDELSRIPVQKGKPSVILTPHNKQLPVAADERLKMKSLSRKTMTFLQIGADDGNWHAEFKIAAKNLKAAGFTKEEATEKLLNITGKLTDADIYQIDYAYKNDTWNYNVEILGKDIHPLREKYYDKVKRKPLQIPEQEIVATFMSERHMDIKVDGRLLLNGEVQDITYILEEIRHFAQTELQTNTNVNTLSSVISKISTDVKLKRFEQLKEYIKFDNSPFDFEQLIEVVTGKRDHLDVAILKHFIWQTKRKMFKKEVKHHIMPVYVGDSGSGKSYHVRNHLLQPISEIVYFDGDFKKLVDSREAFNLCTNYIYLMDEMSKADHADVESIKNKITAPTIQYRRLGTNITCQGDNKATFIGTSNNPIEDIIKDPTSIRRFYQINTVAKIDKEKINQFNYLHMWRSIDENLDEAPFVLPLLEDIKVKQEEFRHKSPLEHFLQENQYSRLELPNAVKIDRNEMYNEFKNWSILNGYKYTLTKHIFCRQIAAKEGPANRGRVDGELKHFYYKLKKTEDE